VLRGIFGMKRDGIGSQRKLYKEKLHNLYPSPNTIRMVKSRRMRWPRHVACMVKKRKTYSVSMGQPEINRPMNRWDYNTEMDFKEIGWVGCTTSE
jgi:hypothetical protein